jgi:hypothetical protein
MKADLTLAERQRLEAEDQRELRAALARRHVEVLDGQHAIGAVELALPVRSPEYRDMAKRIRS